jgi:DMSO/TMAO reductase YedYZ molybdopterin-dependent catalytic subunit
MSKLILPRRRFLGGLALGAGGLALSGCDAIVENEALVSTIRKADRLTYHAQRTLVDRQALAQEFSKADLSPIFRANGSTTVETTEYQQHAREKFANWQLKIGGLVAKPQSFNMRQLLQMPAREQITRHDCVEGWSAIGQWRGTPLALILKAAGLSSRARYLVFHCADTLDGLPYYESIDLVDAFHPQTILAWSMNGQMLPVAHGAPLRLRVERLLGYKHAKYVNRIEAVTSFADIYQGNGGYWEDVSDYEYYGGI